MFKYEGWTTQVLDTSSGKKRVSTDGGTSSQYVQESGDSSDKVLFIGPDSEVFAKKIQQSSSTKEMLTDEDMNSSNFGKKGCCPTCGVTEGKIARDDPTKMSPEQLMEAYMKLSTTLFGNLNGSL